MTTFTTILTLFIAALGLCALGLAFGGSESPQSRHPGPVRHSRSSRLPLRIGEILYARLYLLCR